MLKHTHTHKILIIIIKKGNTNLPPQGISTPTTPRRRPQRQQSRNRNLLKSISVAPLVSNVCKIFWELWKRVVSWETFDPMSGIKKWSTDKVKWETEEKRPRRYKPRNFAEVNVKSLSDDDSYDKEENISWERRKIFVFFWFRVKW